MDLEVREDQEDFVASNVYSLAQLQFVNNFSADVIYDDETMIGFAMYGIDDDDGMFWIWRFMLDAQFQGKGLGKAAFAALLEKITAMNNAREQPLPWLRLSYEPRICQKGRQRIFFVIYEKNSLKTGYKQEINSSGKCKHISHYSKNKTKMFGIPHKVT